MSSATRRLAGGVLASLGAIALVVAASGAPASGVVATSNPPVLDHALCYVATGSGFKVPAGIALHNVIQPTAFVPVVHAIDAQCNPAVEQVVAASGATTTYKVTYASSHLACFSITDKKRVPAESVSVVNAFGDATMHTGAPTKLCVPSWTAYSVPSSHLAASPPDLDHFACYTVAKVAKEYDFSIPKIVRVRDAFSEPKLPAVKLLTASSLCVPTYLTVGTHKYAPKSKRDESLLCYPITSTKIRPAIYDKNQFGTGPLRVTAPHEQLCVPTLVYLD